MDELEKNTPDEFWRKAFDEAAETPPTRVWNTIERRLDESNGPRIIPLWGLGLGLSRPVLWGTGIAASLALLLVGWWVINTQSADQSVAGIQPSSPVENVAIAPVTSANSSVDKSAGQSHVNETVASVSKPSKTSQQPLTVPANQPSSGELGKEYAAQTIARSVQPESLLQKQTTAATALRASSIITKTGVPASAVSRMAVTSFTADRSTVVAAITPAEPKSLAFGPLAGKPLRLRSAGSIQRMVWFQATELPMKPELAKEKRKARDRWASASVMPGAFNPLVSVQSLQSAFNNSSLAYSSSTNQSGVSSRANFSVAYQASAGVQLTKRWSVESGIGYLSGHSTVEAPAQSVAQSSTTNFIQNISANRNSTVSNLYVDALRNASSNKSANSVSQASMDKSAAYNSYITPGNYTNQARQTLSNNYQYVQVPVQVGYQLRPRKRLSLAVLGGLITNIFVRNTVGSDVVVTAKDGVYRPVSLAATVGGRFRYRPSGRWSASLAGLYQPSLGAGTQADSQVQSRPTSTGMSFGVDYHF